MESSLRNLVFFAAAVATALVAGLFYAWVVSVIPGTRRIPDRAYLETMQSINREILNPAFFAGFLGAPLLLIAATVLRYRVGVDSTFYLTLAAAAVYLVGTLGVTIVGNVPLNDAVAALDLPTLSAAELREHRLAYERPWNRLNLLRTLAAVLAFLLLLLAIVRD